MQPQRPSLSEPILVVDVILIGHEETPLEEGLRLVLPFTGTATSQWFTGSILPGAADTQHISGGKLLSAAADYRIRGTDYTGAPCTLHVVNRYDGAKWVPTVEADSPALSFLNGAPCRTEVQFRLQGPIVTIYLDR